MNIAELIRSRYPSFRVPAGTGWLSVRCVFHDDSAASASIHSDGFYKCHSCGVSGNTVEIADRLGVTAPVQTYEPTPQQWVKPTPRKELDTMLKAARRYYKAYESSPAQEHIALRGLDNEQVRKTFGLGFVAEPVEGHERFLNHLAIPYFRTGKDGNPMVIQIRFRCLSEHNHREFNHGKFSGVKGAVAALYNTDHAILKNPTYRVAIAEGEPDTWALTNYGLPTVGVPGAQAWRSDWALLFQDFEEVLIFGDGDDAGRSFTAKVASDIRHARIIMCPENSDAESMLRQGWDPLELRSP